MMVFLSGRGSDPVKRETTPLYMTLNSVGPLRSATMKDSRRGWVTTKRCCTTSTYRLGTVNVECHLIVCL